MSLVDEPQTGIGYDTAFLRLYLSHSRLSATLR